MKKLLFIIPVLIVLLISCQKEADFNNGGGGGGTTNQRLIRIGTRSGADTSTEELGYNTAGKLIRQYISGVESGTPFFIEAKYNRNSSNIITSIVIKSDQLIPLGIDSIVTIVKYNTGTSRYTGTVTSVTLLGFALKDSTIFTSDGSGRITEEESYASNPITGLYAKESRVVYTYLANGNVSNEKYYDYDAAASGYVLSEEYTNEYDTKVNPLASVGMEAIFIGDLVIAAANNLTKSIYVDAADPSNNETTGYTYNYNTANKPATATGTVTPGGAATSYTYTYQ